MEDLFDNEIICYILKSKISNRTYIGSTMNIKRRLRQHNGLIKGGAKATHHMRPYEIICILTGFKDFNTALKCEWLIKHPNGKRYGNNKYHGPNGRIKGLLHLLTKSDKWKSRYQGDNLTIWIRHDLLDYLEINELDKNISINIC